jgi:hypothetical protein
LVAVDWVSWTSNKKPTGQLLLAVGLCQPLKLCASQLTRRPPPEDRLIRADVPVLIDVIRLAFWEVAFMVAVRDLI